MATNPFSNLEIKGSLGQKPHTRCCIRGKEAADCAQVTDIISHPLPTGRVLVRVVEKITARVNSCATCPISREKCRT